MARSGAADAGAEATLRVPLATLCLAAGITAGACARPLDLVLVGGRLLDGTGATPRAADVGILDGRIERIGELDRVRARRKIDVHGLVVAPGFIDMHSHADLIVLGSAELQRRLLGAKLAQGVTTLIVGNCGLGVAPADDEAAAALAGINGWMTPEGVAARPGSFSDYLDALEKGGPLLNVGALVAHGPVRLSVMGNAARPPSPEELDAMRAMLEQALDDGAFGLSTGLIYPPGMYSDTDELAALATSVASRDRLFTCHVRGSSELLARATRELLEIAERSGARVHHSHLEAVGERFWAGIPEVLRLEDAARERGVTVSHDVFPYSRAATMMSAIFPPWSLEGGVPALLERLADPDSRERIRREIAGTVPHWPPWERGGWPHNLVGAVGWDGIRVASLSEGDPTGVVGRSVLELARERGEDPFDFVVRLMREQRGRVGQLVDEISARDDEPDHLLEILEHPAAAVVSDAEDYGRGNPHPAHAGAFARALRLCREHRSMPLERIVERMTGYPALLLGLDDRGVLRAGAWADLVVFDPRTVGDRASWENPRLTAIGFEWVLINGKPVVEHGRPNGTVAGSVLRAGKPARLGSRRTRSFSARARTARGPRRGGVNR